jgi:lipopolysaccharide biosynthesis regulator YciM
MELEIWHLMVLPLFFALGWLAARVDIRHVVKESRSIPASYFRGLNYLLNEQPDKAIEAFLEVARLDPDTLELHFALGALFRRRGELDRAIRIHQNLVDRSDLNQEQRIKALHELGQDFLKAGLLDRAEVIFRKLEGSQPLDALRHLLEIFVLEKDWPQAIATAERLERLGSPAQFTETAHYHCELAQVALLRGEVDAARRHLDAALASNRKSARAMQLLGDLEARTGNDAAAIAAWRQVEALNPAYLPVVGERLLRAYQRLNQAPAGLELLAGYLERHPSADLFHTLFQAVAEQQGWDAAARLAADVLKRQPGLRVLDDYLQAKTALAGEAADLEARMAQDLVHKQVSRLAFYQCDHCGFKARQFFWQCPACARWEGIPPERREAE